MPKIEALLSARLFLQPQCVNDQIYFISNLSGRLSLYRMKTGGSVPLPLLPPNLALQNPHLVDGESFCVFPRLGKIVVMIDRDGDENYQPMTIPLEGGFPEVLFNEYFSPYRVHLVDYYPDQNLLYLSAESTREQMISSYQAHLDTGELIKLGESPYGSVPIGVNANHDQAVLVDQYTIGDNVLYLWTKGIGERKLFYGIPLEKRQPGATTPLNDFNHAHFLPDHRTLLLTTVLFDDRRSLATLPLDQPTQVEPVEIRGTKHQGDGELVRLKHLIDNRYLLEYNIDGCSWLYEGEYDDKNRIMRLYNIICGQGELSNGVLESVHYDSASDRFALAFSTATSPTQIYTVQGLDSSTVIAHTQERILGINPQQLSKGEDASFTSFDGTRISARLYLPVEQLAFSPPYPLVYYVHGGPQSQERPDFAWFSMPLIQFLTLNGFAVFVPNVRGSTGYGFSYTKQVDRDWGGKDRQDHVFAMTEVLPKDPRLNVSRAGVVGRSYGGYMSLMLAGMHPELWSAAVDMFGPYDLLTFFERIPETWKPYYRIALGDPDIPADRQFLVERSPRTHLHNLACPLLVIQGKNDPRVVERESSDLVKALRQQGKQVEYLVFENEGHDVLKYENRVACYNAITDFFKTHLKSS